MAESKNDWIMPTVLIGGGLLLFSGVINKIFHIFDKSQEVKDNEAAASKNYWSPNYYKEVMQQYGSAHILTYNGAVALSKDIYEALAHVFDEDDIVIGIFQKLTYKTQVSYLADIFQQKYGKSLYTYLLNGGGWSWASGMKTANLTIVNNLVKQMK